MKKTSLPAIVALAVVTSMASGCFNDDSSVVVGTDSTDISASDAESNEVAMTDTVSSEQTQDVSQTTTEQSAHQDIRISSASTNSAADDAWAAFQAQSSGPVLPIDMPEKDGVSHTPMKTNGTIVLKAAQQVPPNHPTYNDDDLLQCASAPTSEAFYCSDQYLLQVQNTKNRIKLKDGSEIVLTPAANGLADNYILTYIQDGVAMPSHYILSPFGDDALEVKYGRVNNEACIYGSVDYLGQEGSHLYTCYKPSQSEDRVFTGPLVSGTANKTSFLDIDLASLPKTSYSSFIAIQK